MAVFKSKLYAARKGTGSLKTTIPKQVVAAFQVKPGDELEWEVDQGEVRGPQGGKPYTTVTARKVQG